MLFLLLPLAGFAQVDVFQSGTITLGLKYKSTSYSGMYLKVQDLGSPAVIYRTEKIELMKDNGSAINLDAQFYKFSKSGFEIYNLDGLLYLLSYFGNMNSNHNGELYYSLANLFTTPSKTLGNVQAPVDFKKPGRFWNFNGIDIKGEFGKKNLNFGVNILFKLVGIRGPFTWFEDNNHQYIYHNMNDANMLKTLIGPNVAYRKNFKKFSLASVAGVNFCSNRNTFKISNDSYINVVCFAGKRLGITAGLKYELINGRMAMGYQDGGTLNSKVLISQYELNLGICMDRRWKKAKKS